MYLLSMSMSMMLINFYSSYPNSPVQYSFDSILNHRPDFVRKNTFDVDEFGLFRIIDEIVEFSIEINGVVSPDCKSVAVVVVVDCTDVCRFSINFALAIFFCIICLANDLSSDLIDDVLDVFDVDVVFSSTNWPPSSSLIVDFNGDSSFSDFNNFDLSS
ncbi:hypothetical protein DERP_011967 [Dermatophagoides pteronyssinus]|uniref:Uncharacterized protein n=1 Tax=Dermatophagoides pteronyssinus TaxID=6956 RepID=A0ABQ8J2W9_DERPT|nr:hypothetical protein DERP_011967 [Dermatophagoides pteronyssinus]